MTAMPDEQGKFIRVRCTCKNEQVIFGRAATKVLCLVCGGPLAEPTGGKVKLFAQVVEILR